MYEVRMLFYWILSRVFLPPSQATFPKKISCNTSLFCQSSVTTYSRSVNQEVIRSYHMYMNVLILFPQVCTFPFQPRQHKEHGPIASASEAIITGDYRPWPGSKEKGAFIKDPALPSGEESISFEVYVQPPKGMLYNTDHQPGSFVYRQDSVTFFTHMLFKHFDLQGNRVGH